MSKFLIAITYFGVNDASFLKMDFGLYEQIAKTNLVTQSKQGDSLKFQVSII